MRQSQEDRALTRALESYSRGELSPRENIYHKGLCSVDASGVSGLWEYRNRSTLLPSLWRRSHASNAEKLGERAVELHAAGYRFLRVVVEPREALSGGVSLPDEVRRSHDFFREARRVLKRANASLRLKALGVSVVLVAGHCGVRAAHLRPHLHALALCSPGVSADAARELLASLFEKRNHARLAWASEKNREFIESEKLLGEHVVYLHRYPVSGYVENESLKESLAPVLRRNERSVIAALAALSETFCLKNMVVTAGVFRAKATKPEAKEQSTTTGQSSDAIRADLQSEAASVVDGEVVVEGVVEDAAGDVAPEVLGGDVTGEGPFYLEPPLCIGEPPALWEEMLTAPDDLPQIPPERRHPPKRSDAVILRVHDAETGIPGLVRRRVVTLGCWWRCFESVAEKFPQHGEQWELERVFDKMRHAGHPVSVALAVAKREARVWRVRVDAEASERAEYEARWEKQMVIHRAREASRSKTEMTVKAAERAIAALHNPFKVARENRFKLRPELARAVVKYLSKGLRFHAQGRLVVGVVAGAEVIRCEVDSDLEASTVSEIGNKVFESREAVEKARERQVAEMCAA